MALVCFDDVQKSYRSLQGADYVAVNHFSVEIEAGEFFCLFGPSGCGKTTVLKLLAGFEAPTAGRILMEGRPVTGASRDREAQLKGQGKLAKPLDWGTFVYPDLMRKVLPAKVNYK